MAATRPAEAYLQANEVEQAAEGRGDKTALRVIDEAIDGAAGAVVEAATAAADHAVRLRG